MGLAEGLSELQWRSRRTDIRPFVLSTQPEEAQLWIVRVRTWRAESELSNIRPSPRSLGRCAVPLFSHV